MLSTEKEIVNNIKSMMSMSSSQYGALCFIANHINELRLSYNSLAIAYMMKPLFDTSIITAYIYKNETYYTLSVGTTFIRHLLETSCNDDYTPCSTNVPSPADVFKKDKQYKQIKSLLNEADKSKRTCCHCSKEHSSTYYWNAYHAACYNCSPEPAKKQAGAKVNIRKFLQSLNGRIARLSKAENAVEEATKLLQDLMIHKDELKRYIDVENLMERVQEGFRQHS